MFNTNQNHQLLQQNNLPNKLLTVKLLTITLLLLLLQ